MSVQIKKVINGEVHTRSTVVEKHGRLVYQQCHKLKNIAKNVGQDYEDIVSEGFIGLIKAFDRFDGDKFNVRFSTYASPYISGTIWNYLHKQNAGFKYPRNIKLLGWKILSLDMEELSSKEIAKHLDESVLMVDRALGFLQNGNPHRLDAVMSTNEATSTMNEIVGNTDDFSGVFINDYLQSLVKRERFIAESLYLGKKQIEIGKMLKLSQAQVSRLIKKMRVDYRNYEGGAVTVE